MVALVYPLKLTAYQAEIWSMIYLMAAFGPAHTLFSYLISFGFLKPQSALKFIALAYMIAGFVLPFVFKMIIRPPDPRASLLHLFHHFNLNITRGVQIPKSQLGLHCGLVTPWLVI